MLSEQIEAVIVEAVEEFMANRELQRAMDVLAKAAGNDVIPLGSYDDAERELKKRIDEILADEDGVEPNEWERISRTSLLDKVVTEHTETAIDVGVKSGAIVPVADETSP